MASTTIAQNFAEKVSRCRHVLDSAVVIERDGESAKGKRKNQPGKRGKPRLTKPEARQRRVCQTVHSSEECTDNRDEIYWVGCSF